MNQTTNFKKQEQKAILTMYSSIALFTIGLVAIAILLGIWISQLKGETTWMSWIPLFAALPVNLLISSVFSKKTAKKVMAIRQARASALEANQEPQSKEE